MLPALILLFLLFVAGPVSAFVLYLAPPCRYLVPFALVPVCASVGAFVLCVVLSMSLQQLFHSQQAGGLGFLGGYFLGGLLGAWAGGWIAWRRVRRRPVPNHALQRTEAGHRVASDLQA